MSVALVDRAFVRLDAGLIHYRFAGRETGEPAIPLVMAHGGPGSSLGLAPLVAELGAGRCVVAPDMMGNGESDPPPMAQPDIGFYADCLVRVMDRLGLHQVALYGHHTGAQVVSELAVHHPDRVRGVVLDGLGLFPEALRAEFLERYAPPLVADENGAFLRQAWEFVARTTQVFPHYSTRPEDRIAAGGAPPPASLAGRAAEVLKAWSTYHLAYRAAFQDDLAGRLSRLRGRVLILEVEGDPLATYARQAAALIPTATVVKTTRTTRAAALQAFMASLEQA